jgi:hypothetical protein
MRLSTGINHSIAERTNLVYRGEVASIYPDSGGADPEVTQYSFNMNLEKGFEVGAKLPFLGV